MASRVFDRHRDALTWVRTVVAEGAGTGCRDWPGSTNPKGYGDMGHDGKTRLVGHVVLELSGRPRPGSWANQLHSCDRPVCVAPWHLRWGTNAENHAESKTKGRSCRGESRPTAKLTEAAVRDIRASSDLLRVLAERYGVGVPTVHKAKHGATWQHVS